MNVDIDKPRPGTTRIKEKLETLSSMIDESDHAPTHGAREVYDTLVAQLETQRRALAEALDSPLRAFNEALTTLKIPLVGP